MSVSERALKTNQPSAPRPGHCHVPFVDLFSPGSRHPNLSSFPALVELSSHFELPPLCLSAARAFSIIHHGQALGLLFPDVFTLQRAGSGFRATRYRKVLFISFVWRAQLVLWSFTANLDSFLLGLSEDGKIDWDRIGREAPMSANHG